MTLLQSASRYWLLGASLALTACATTKTERLYPPRRPGCTLTVTYGATPTRPEWDDIGVAQVGCYLDEGEGPCLHRLKAEACRMGGDILYGIPHTAARPGEREMVMRAHVAHSRGGKPAEPPPAPSTEPVIPIGSPAPAPARDAGTPVDAVAAGNGRG
jgi:hypothetical protein